MRRHILLEFVDDGIAVKAELLEAEAPRTCATLLEHLPLVGTGYHARYSGSEVAMFIDKGIHVEREHATSAVLPGEIAYIHLKKDEHFMLEDDVSEICWFYDRDAQPREWEGPIPANIFARVVDDFEAFQKASADCRLVGPKRVRISLCQ